MRFLNRSALLFFTAAIVFSPRVLSAAADPPPPLIPRKILFGNPVRAAFQISPDGKRLTYLAPDEGVLNVWISTIGKADDRPVTRDRGRGIQAYFWAPDNEHIVYIQDREGDENWRLYAVHLPTGKIRDLTPFEKVQAGVLDVDKHFPDEMLIVMNRRDERFHDVYHLRLSTGEITLVAENPGNVSAWLPDTQLRVRGILVSRPDAGYDLRVRKDEGAEWKTVLRWEYEDSMVSSALSFSKDGNSLVLIDSRGADTGRLVRFDIETARTTVLAEDPEFDMSGAMLHPDSYEVQAATVTRDRTEWIVFDEAIRPDMEALSELADGDFSIISRDHADRYWLVRYENDDRPVAYYLFDRREKKGTFLFYHQPELRNYRLATTEPFRILSRDGLVLRGYLTFPPGAARKNLPAVLNVHGGPWSRDVWGYDSRVQWFANRGYLCLEVNYRSSVGFGKKFVNAGDREWGRNMQNDLADAVEWAVKSGYAAPDRIGIFGASYGGYAALAGAAFTPGLFRCAVDVVGPSNLITFIKSVPPYWTTELATIYRRVGDPDKDAGWLKTRSPFFQAGRIRIPVLIAQGANDPRVKKEESEQIVEALKKNGVEYEYLLFPDEGHGFVKPENRLKFYASAEAFLARHLGGRSESGAK